MHVHALPARQTPGDTILVPGPDVDIAVLKRLPVVLDIFTTRPNVDSVDSESTPPSMLSTSVSTMSEPETAPFGSAQSPPSKPLVDDSMKLSTFPLADPHAEPDGAVTDVLVPSSSSCPGPRHPITAHPSRVLVLLRLPWAVLHGLQYGDVPTQPLWTLRDFDAALFGQWWQSRRDKEKSLWAEKLALWLLRRDPFQQLSRAAKRTEANITTRDQQVCEGCYRLQPAGYVSAPFKLCSGCCTFVFCSVECHKRAWPVHAEICRYIRTCFSRQETQCIKQLFMALHGEHPVLLDLVCQRAAKFRERLARPDAEHVYRLQMRFASFQRLQSTVSEAGDKVDG